MPDRDVIRPGAIVKWTNPTDEADAAMRFDVLEAHYDVERPRALIRARAECMPNWNPNLLPISTVNVSDLEIA